MRGVQWSELWKRFWVDETGVTVCSEVVVVGTVAVLAAVTGLSVAVDAFEEEAIDYGAALRGLNQGYHVDGYCVDGAYTEPSGFVQTAADVRRDVERFRREARAKVDRARRRRDALRREWLGRLKDQQNGGRSADAAVPEGQRRAGGADADGGDRSPGVKGMPDRREPDARGEPSAPRRKRRSSNSVEQPPASGIRAQRSAPASHTPEEDKTGEAGESLDPRVPVL
ncbi:MAG: hypothetical protein D6725_16885 [Planctomycetota bacterium]|nr:MAG: hypothetical protein D6725_16885 [Planctomycetota bacterium]